MSKLVIRDDLINILQGFDHRFEEIERTIAKDRGWINVNTSGEIIFQNNWVNYGGSYQTAQCARDFLGNVFIRGCIKNGVNGSTAFTLPNGYWPASTNIFLTHSYNATSGSDWCRLVIQADGQVKPITDYGLTEEVWINCSFKFGSI